MTPRSAIPREIFLSHAARDAKLVRSIVELLRRHRLRVWYAPSHIAGGRRWHDEIGRALARCDWFAVVLTKSSVRSRWVKRELQFALENSSYDDRIVPILCQDCDHRRLSWTLSSFQMIDFRRNHSKGAARLLAVWDIVLRDTGSDKGKRR